MPASRPLGVSTSVFGTLFGPQCPETALASLAGTPVTHLEYFCVDATGRYRDPNHVHLVRQVAQDAGLTWASVHAPFDGTDISLDDEPGRTASVHNVVAAMNLAVALGAPLVVVHGSGEPVEDGRRSGRLDQCARSLDALGAAARSRGLRLALELLPRSCLGNRTPEMLWLLGHAGSDVGVCYDVNHITLYEPAGASLRALGSHVFTLHISDHDGRDEKHWIPGRGVVDWEDFTAGLDEIGYRGCLMHEAVDPDLDLAGNVAAIVAAARRYLRWKA